MPVINPKDSSSSNTQRATFRPPWVRDGPTPLPMPAAPWTSKGRGESNVPNSTDKVTRPEKPTLRKQTKVTIPIESPPPSSQTIPIRNEISKPVSQRQEKVIPIKVVHESSNPASKTVPRQSNQTNNTQAANWRREKPLASPERPQPISKPPVTMQNEKNMPPVTSKPPPRASSKPPPPPMPPNAPPPPPMVPPPPPPIDSSQQKPIVRKPPTKEKVAKLDALRSRPRRRPDWSDMMKEVESGRKLKHVQCNDRSAPVIPQSKAKGQFVYESENKKEESHDKLLKQIQGGIRLKKVKINDRSKPNLDGLRKFKREMTIEEQLQKSVSMADVVAAAVQPDELDDIDKVRDDLQSAKQMLALELRNKEAIERDNKRLLARLANLEAELEKEKSMRKAETQTEKGYKIRTDEDEKLIVKLKEESSESDRIAKEMEQRYHATAEQLDNMRRKLESAWLRNQEIESQLKSVSQGTPVNQLMKQPSKKFISIANGGSVDLISDDEEETESETEEDSDHEESSTKEKQICRELRLLTSKLRTFREKQVAALKERRILREQLTKKQKDLKEEKKKYKLLQKEVDKMAKLMKEQDEDFEEDEIVEEEESDTETESEESEEEESDNEVPHNATAEEKRKLLLNRTKRHENRLSSLKKGNNLMKANIERLEDDVNNQREMSLTLQEDLNNILADLG